MLERARIEEASQVEIKESLEHFPSTLPVKRDSAFSAWVSVSVGCNNTCTFCIVPSLRGIEKDRPMDEIMKEVRALVDQGVIEITLLGQNVNAYGVDFGDRGAFAKLLRQCGQVQGLERVRFMSPHPRDFTDDVIDAMAQTKNVMPHLHMPLQSGSNQILQAMRRSYRRERYLGIIEKVRAAMPDAAITTDIIVGFPGESDAAFMDLIEFLSEAQLDAIGVFGYSDEDKTEAESLANKVAPELIAERVSELSTLVDELITQRSEMRIGEKISVLIEDEGEQEGRAEHQGPDVDGSTFVKSRNKYRVGEYVDAVVSDVAGVDLIAQVI